MPTAKQRAAEHKAVTRELKTTLKAREGTSRQGKLRPSDVNKAIARHRKAAGGTTGAIKSAKKTMSGATGASRLDAAERAALRINSKPAKKGSGYMSGGN